ncbi:MAG: bifunctional oligoribonuclease/PAP phosphatase NrnA [Firmicutes bacterium]|nr:bifunctional oligoribonuclease/PAP phosphatase NrnA [Bacillota bacterium]
MEINGLKKNIDVAVISHIRPDGDTIGAACALSGSLDRWGCRTYLFCDSTLTDSLKVIPGSGKFNTSVKSSFDLVISVDCAEQARLGVYEKLFSAHKNTVNIDHHKTNPGYGRQNIIESASSTCEIIYGVLKKDALPIDKDIAAALYAGVVTDTGGFMQSNTTPECFSVAAELAAYGIDVEFYAQKLIREYSRNKLALIARCISGIEFFEGGKIAFIGIRHDDLKECGVEVNDTEGIINYAFNIRETEIAVCMTQSARNAFKASFRSKHGIDVARAAAVFGGGGHKQAAGCMLNGFFEDVKEKLVAAAAEQLHEISPLRST